MIKPPNAKTTNHNKSSSGAVGFALGVILVLLASQLQHSSQDTANVHEDTIKILGAARKTQQRPSWSLENGIIEKEVERIEWSSHLPFTSHVFYSIFEITWQLLKMRTPFVLRNTIVTTWPALDYWKNKNYLANHPSLSMLANVQMGPEETFGFVDTKTPLAEINYPGINLTTSYVTLNMTSKEFFNRISDVEDNNYYYWYGKVDGRLVNDVQPHSWVWASAEDRSQFGMFMWLSGNDTRPPIHYDQDHNFFIHVAGSKMFVLYPPWEWEHLYPFPRVHPRWHKSQVGFDRPDLARMPKYKEARAWKVLLEPGDVLYVPPYWWHHVQSVTASATWSQSGVYRVMQHAYSRSYFIDSISSEDTLHKRAAIKHFIGLLLGQLYGEGAAEFLQKGIETRWMPMYDTFKHESAFSDPTFCDFGEHTNADFSRKFAGDLTYLIERLNSCQGVDVSLENRDVRAIRDLEVFDFIETLACDASIGANNAFPFLAKCIYPLSVL